jgi:methyl-accepting chemotaxis protein
MVEESTAASHSLAKEAGELAELASKFDIGESAPAARVVHRPQPKRLPAPSRPATPAGRPMPTHGNAALKPAPEAEEGNWEEF